MGFFDHQSYEFSGCVWILREWCQPLKEAPGNWKFPAGSPRQPNWKPLGWIIRIRKTTFLFGRPDFQGSSALSNKWEICKSSSLTNNTVSCPKCWFYMVLYYQDLLGHRKWCRIFSINSRSPSKATSHAFCSLIGSIRKYHQN